jgi:ribosomal protein S18 acetylase RimI-like enzyme
MAITIRQIELDELPLALAVLNELPEFDSTFTLEQLILRLEKAERILLLAEENGEPVGCKIAYNRYFNGSIYSWLGGVLPQYRRQGVATLLLAELENEARKRFFLSLRFKTRNKHKAMLRFAIGRGFYVVGFEAREKPSSNSVIEFQKELH